MKTLSLHCNNCGAPLSIPEKTRYVTCTFCDTRLLVHSEGGAAYTEILERIEERTEEIAERLETLERHTELERIDREWMMEREGLLVSDKEGDRREPSAAGAVVGSVIVVVFGIFWLGMASSMGAPGPMVAFGFVFIAAALFGGLNSLSKASEYRRKQREYQERRRRAEGRIDPD